MAEARSDPQCSIRIRNGLDKNGRGWVCIRNGVDKEPCAIQTYKYLGGTFVRIDRLDGDWCRLLTSKAPYTRPFAKTTLFSVWKAAVRCGDKATLHALEPDVEELEGGSDDEDHALTWRMRKRLARTSPILTIVMPRTVNGPADYRLRVHNTMRTFSFEYTLDNVQWARDYIMSERTSDSGKQ